VKNRVREKLLLLWFCLAWLTASARATTITGTVADAAGTVLPSGTIILKLSQEGLGSLPVLLLTSPPILCQITNGVIAAGCTVTGNDAISPVKTYYKVRIVSDSNQEYLPERHFSITGTAWNIGTATPLATDTIAATAYQQVADEGTVLIQQRSLNFIGSGIACADNPALSRTDCTVSGTGANEANEEGPAGQINDINVTFTLAHSPSPATSLKLVLNGLTLRSGAGNDFTITANTITFAYAPTSGSNLITWYQY